MATLRIMMTKKMKQNKDFVRNLLRHKIIQIKEDKSQKGSIIIVKRYNKSIYWPGLHCNMKNIDYDNDFPLDYLEIQLIQHFLEIQLLQHYLEIQLLQQTIVILRTTHNEAIKLYQLLLLYLQYDLTQVLCCC